MRGWIALLVLICFVSGCVAHRPVEKPPAVPATAPDGSPLTGSYDEGVTAGDQAASGSFVAGWFVLGAVSAPFVLVCFVTAAALGGGGSGGGCNGPGSSGHHAPHDADFRTPAYVSGYDNGYRKRYEDRRDGALLLGFLVGAGITVAAVWFYVNAERRRDATESEAGQHMTAGGRRGATIFQF